MYVDSFADCDPDVSGADMGYFDNNQQGEARVRVEGIDKGLLVHIWTPKFCCNQVSHFYDKLYVSNNTVG